VRIFPKPFRRLKPKERPAEEASFDCKYNSYNFRQGILSPVYTTLNFWYGTDKIGTPTTFLVLAWTTYLDSPRTKKVVRYQKSSVV
jgi:hypothetical protein